jgi:CSLREA domain-containing protein
MRRMLALVVGTAAALLILLGLRVAPVRAACSAAITVANANDSGAGSLRAAIANICTDGTITFSAAIANSTITLTTLDPSGNGALVVSRNLTIDGGSNHITISGGGSLRVLYVATGTVAMRSVTLTAGVADYGGAIWNGGTLTLTDVTLDANAADPSDGHGGAIDNEGVATIVASTFHGNTGTFGGAVHNGPTATLTVGESTFTGNTGTTTGGAIDNNGAMTVVNSTFAGNSALSGGAIFNLIYNGPPSELSVTNSTFAGNSAHDGGAIYAPTSATLTNSLFAHQTTGANCGGTVSGSANLADDDSCGSPATTSILLGTLGSYGGATETIPLLPGSAAIDGATANCPADDQRGIPRGATCDIGAFESRGFTLTKTGGDGQSASVNTAFGDPLAATLTETGGLPLPGATITFTAPASGPSAALSSGTATTNPSGVASVTATANGAGGSYGVTAGAPGVSTVSFGLTNIGPQPGPTFTVNANADTDDGTCGVTDCTLREAINAANAQAGANTVIFDGVSEPIILTSALPLIVASGGDLGIDGGQTVEISGDNAYPIFQLGLNANLTLHGLVLTEATAAYGAAINSTGTLTVSGTTFDGNAAAIGGAIWSHGSLTVSDSTFDGNSAGIYGGAIHIDGGSITLASSTFIDNSAASGGGALLNGSLGTATVVNTTFRGNSGGYGGAIDSFGSLAVTNSTFQGNAAAESGGAISSVVAAVVRNSVFVRGASGANCDGSIATVLGSPNRADDASCGGPAISADAIRLGILGDYGGPTDTIPLLPGSAAINGATANCPASDQRHTARGTTCDLGAVEMRDFVLSVTVDHQLAIINTAFADPLEVTLRESGGARLPGAPISFSAPSSGASAVLSSATATTDAQGIAGVTATANGITGSYTVTAQTLGGDTIDFSRTNTYSPEPANQASGVTFGEFGPGTITVHWTAGGPSSIVLMKAGAAVNAAPVDGATYVASPVFGGGSEIGDGNFVAFAGPGNAVTLTGLSGTVYHVAVFSFEGSDGTENYLVPDPARGSQAVDATAPTATIAATSPVTSRPISVRVGGSDAGSGVAAYAVVEGTSAPATGDPAWKAWPSTVPFDTSLTVATGDGDHTISAFTRDAFGNVSDVATAHVMLDIDAPTATLAAPASSAARTIDVTVGGSDGSGTGVTAYALVEGTGAPDAGSSAWVASPPTKFRLSAGDGVKTLSSFARDGVGHVSAPATRSVTLAVGSPVAALTVPSFVTAPNVPLDWTGSAGGGSLAINGYFVSTDGTTPDPSDPRWQGSAPATFALVGPDGGTTLYAWIRNADGAVSPRVAVTTTLDTAAPAAPGRPSLAVAREATIGTTIPVTLAWTAATDTTSGPVTYTLAASANGGATWTTQALASPDATSASLSLAAGSWTFRVRATDRAGNSGAWATCGASSLALVQENARGVKAVGGFKRIRLVGASGGYVSAAKKKNASVTFSATGTTYFLVSDRGTARGKATVYVDGRKVATIDLYARTTTTGSIVWSRTYARAGRHTLKVVVSGQKNRKATSTQVDLDAFIVKG